MTKIKIAIKHYLTGSVLFEYEEEGNTIAKTLQEAVSRYANLSYANLRSANLSSADLSSANLSYADLRSADLRYADLRSADLRYADLRSADLRYANLSYADLSSANLSYADLRSADLRSADLSSANLSYADLRSADLRLVDFKNLPISYINLASRDMLFIFQSLKSELPFLREKLIEGKVNGTAYDGECACLVGTLGNANGGVNKVCEAIPYYDKGTHNPAEAWFLSIREGDTPKNNHFAKHALKLIDSVLNTKEVKKKK